MSRLILIFHLIGLAAWCWFSIRVAPGLIVASFDEAESTFVHRAFRLYGGNRTVDAKLQIWREAIPLIAAALVIHAGLAATIVRRVGPAPLDRAAGGLLILVGLPFLGATVLTGAVQDYVLYLDIWREVLRGHDPWYLVPGGSGGFYSLHAYGPLYNALALPTLAGPLGPKLLFAASYLGFAAYVVLTIAPRGGSPPWVRLMLALWLAGPFAWLEVAYFGHFDVLVGLLSVAAVEARLRGRWKSSAAWLAAGVLLKYFPAVLAPFLAVERRETRWRYVAGSAGLSIAGIAIAWAVWGNSVFRPFSLAIQRQSDYLSIFRWLRGPTSPIGRDTLFFSPDQYATPLMLFALYEAWRWVMRTGFELPGSAVLAATITLLLYKVGFPQYYMMLFMLSAYWFAGDYARIRLRALPAATCFACFAVVAWFDVRIAVGQVEDVVPWIGVPMFGLMLALTAAIAATGPRALPEERPAGPADGG